MPAVIHIKHGHEDGIRILTEEPIGSAASHSLVTVTGPAGPVAIYLAGQREFIVPTGSETLIFDDGVTYNIPETHS